MVVSGQFHASGCFTHKEHQSAPAETLGGFQSRFVRRVKEKLILPFPVAWKGFLGRTARSLVTREFETSEVQR